MIEEKNLVVKKYLDKFPKQIILDYLQQLDVQFNELNKESSQDFLQINNSLKGNYKQFKNIKETNLLISQFTAYNKLLCDSNYLNQNHLQEDALSGTQHYTQLVEEQLKEGQNIISRLEKTLNKIEFNKQATSLIEKISTQKEVFNRLLDFSANSASVLNSYINKISCSKRHNGSLKTVDITDDLNNKVEICTQSFQSLVVKIQFFDIISQKLEHIQHSQKELANSLSLKNNGNNFLDWAAKAKTVSDIQIAQLDKTQKDFNESKIEIYNSSVLLQRSFSQIFKLYEKFAASLNDQPIIIDNNATLSTEEIYDINNFIQKFVEQGRWDDNLNAQVFVNKLIKLIQTNQSFQDSLSQDSIDEIMTGLTAMRKCMAGLQSLRENIKLELVFLRNSGILPSKITEKEQDIHSGALSAVEKSITFFDETEIKVAKEPNTAYFNNHISNIKELINGTISALDFEKIKDYTINDSRILEELESQYTMDSEREVHNSLTGKNYINHTPENNSQLSDNELELF